MRPFRALNDFYESGLTLLERMAGTTRLELATSAVTDMEEHGRHRKSLQVRRRQRYCVSRCVSCVKRPPGLLENSATEAATSRNRTSENRPAG
jgi:hypothetical protein